jgi:hypothetical protein
MLQFDLECVADCSSGLWKNIEGFLIFDILKLFPRRICSYICPIRAAILLNNINVKRLKNWITSCILVPDKTFNRKNIILLKRRISCGWELGRECDFFNNSRVQVNEGGVASVDFVFLACDDHCGIGSLSVENEETSLCWFDCRHKKWIIIENPVFCYFAKKLLLPIFLNFLNFAICLQGTGCLVI